MHIRTATEATIYLRRVMLFEQEEFWILCLTSGLRLISSQLIFIGTVDRCLVHPRDIFRYALIHNSSQIMLAHCHPMGKATPSREDHRMTHRLVSAGQLLGIPVIDHLILSRDDHSSCMNVESSFRHPKS